MFQACSKSIEGFKAINLKLNTLVESDDPVLLTGEEISFQHFI
jgi:hypothetical protein